MAEIENSAESSGAEIKEDAGLGVNDWQEYYDADSFSDPDFSKSEDQGDSSDSISE